MSRIRLLILVVWILSCAWAVGAQDEPSPIIVLHNGDLWMWNGADDGMRQMTFWGYNQQPIMSPVGTHVAYMAWAQVTVDAIEREGGIAGGEVPGDIKILDVATGLETTIAGQPPDAAFFAPDLPDKAVIRSKPAWSPDGTRLAWTEYDYPSESQNRVMVYRLDDGAVQITVSSLPLQAGVPVPMEVAWGKSGLILRSNTESTDEPGLFETTFLVYDPAETDKLLTSIPIPENEARFLMGFIVVMYDHQEYIGAGYNTGEWDLFDPLTGDAIPAPSPPEMYSPSAPKESLSFMLLTSGSEGVRYQLLDTEGEPIGDPFDMGFDASTHMALSPDGQSVAFLPYEPDASTYNDWVRFVKDGHEAPSVQINPYGFTFLWGPIAWRIRSQS
jgi:hypothetical protein